MRRSTKPLGKRLQEARLAAHLSQDDAAYALRRILPPTRKPTGSMISRIEGGLIAEPEIYIVAGLAKIYDRPLELLAPEYIADAIAVKALLDEMVIDLCDPGEQHGDNSTCIASGQLDLFSETMLHADVRSGGAIWELSATSHGDTSIVDAAAAKSRLRQLVA